MIHKGTYVGVPSSFRHCTITLTYTRSYLLIDASEWYHQSITHAYT